MLFVGGRGCRLALPLHALRVLGAWQPCRVQLEEGGMVQRFREATAKGIVRVHKKPEWYALPQVADLKGSTSCQTLRVFC